MYLVETIYGSRLFGTAVESSDIDKKRVYLCGMQDLVFGRTDTHNTSTGEGKDKVEIEEHHISTFCRMVRQGQTLALSLLFTPENMTTHRTPQWDELIHNRHRLVSRNLKPFVGYARSQAVKYSLKGERLRTLEDFIAEVRLLADFTDETGRLEQAELERLHATFGSREGVRLWVEETAGGPVRHIEVCGRSFGETTPLKLWVPPLETMYFRYGKRSLKAKEDNGSDLKAMYHAVRLAGEMNELLRTGFLTYPRPEAPLLLDIRNGKLTNGEVSDLIDRALEEGDRLFETSTLPEKPDALWLADWEVRTQGDYAMMDWQDQRNLNRTKALTEYLLG